MYPMPSFLWRHIVVIKSGGVRGRGGGEEEEVVSVIGESGEQKRK